MHDSLANPPKLFARSAAGRMVQIAGRPGEVGKLDNVIVPDEREIRRLRPAVTFMSRLKAAPFNYGTLSSYRRHVEPATAATVPTAFNRLDNLPLFQKL